MTRPVELLIATRNAGKKRELAGLLEGTGIVLRTLDEFPNAPEPEETGATFRENALLKARSGVAATGLWTLADDSGLCVAALFGAPGVHSARYAQGSDRARWEKLLAALSGVSQGERGAAFECALALCGPGGETVVVEGRCPGHIAQAPRGEQGFGYDPVFEVEGAGGRTMAELSAAEKGEMGHRGRALRAMRPHLQRLAESSGE